MKSVKDNMIIGMADNGTGYGDEIKQVLGCNIANAERIRVCHSGTSPNRSASLLRCSAGSSPHDLRRTARTIMARLGVPEEHAEAVLNHKKQGIVKVYNLHQYADEKKAALLLWEKELLRIISE